MSLTSPHPDLHGSILMLSPAMEAFHVAGIRLIAFFSSSP
jgi:hypothetical protein